MSTSTRGRLSLRKAMVWLHRYVGLAMAGFLAIAGFTGSIIAFQPELDVWLNPTLLRAEPHTKKLTVSEQAELVEAAYPQAEVSTAHFLDGPDSSQVFWVDARAASFPLPFNQVFVDPGTGEILGTRDYGAPRLDREHIIPFIYKLHYSLHLPGRWGEWLLGGISIAWMFDCFVGFYLTLPAHSTKRIHTSKSRWQRWRTSWQIKQGASPTRLTLDLHRAGGLWLWGLLLIMAMSSVAMNLNASVFVPVVKLFGTVSEEPKLQSPPTAPHATPPNIGWDKAIEQARLALPREAKHWRLRWAFHARQQGAYTVSFVEAGSGRRGLRFEDITIDATSGVRLAYRSYDQGTPADRFLAWQYPLHSGQIANLPGRIVVCLLGLAITALCITGVMIWARKRMARKKYRAT